MMKTIFTDTNMKRLLSFFAVVVLPGAQSLQAQWVQTSGFYESDVTCFAVNGSNFCLRLMRRRLSFFQLFFKMKLTFPISRR